MKVIPPPLTAFHDTLKAGDESFTVLVTVTPWTLEGDGDGGGGGVGAGAKRINNSSITSHAGKTLL